MTFDVTMQAGEAARIDARHRARGCSNPVRLVGSTTTVNPATGEVIDSYRSADEVDGFTYVRCGDRRAARCPSCSHEYKGDAWHLVSAGLTGGKGVPVTVTAHPAVFVTLTAPSFGLVHGRRPRTRRCRPRRDRPVCPHGRPAYCNRRHEPDDPDLGEPLCADCYDYTAHVVWQWHAPELWRRFTIALHRHLADRLDIPRGRLRRVLKVSYTKVTEFQTRGVIHLHAIVRIDGPTGPDSHPAVPVDVDTLTEAVTAAAGAVRVIATPHGHVAYRLRFGEQHDVRPITVTAHRDAAAGEAHPHQIAAYLAKYLTKTTEDFGLPNRVRHPADAWRAGASHHAQRIIQTAHHLARHAGPTYQRLRQRYATLGYRGHPITKTRRWSTTFSALRRQRQQHHRRRPVVVVDIGQDHTTHDDDTTTVVMRTWQFAGVGYLDLPEAAEAVTTAARTRAR